MTKKTPLQILKTILAPAGGGIHLVSTGLEQTKTLQRRIYGANTNEEIVPRWHKELESIAQAKVAILGVPSDAGAGFVRGSNLGPSEIRRFLLDDSSHPFHEKHVLDIGDVRVVPHFLSDEMLSKEQILESRNSLYGDQGHGLPVSPLNQCKLALAQLRAINSNIIPIVLGGDHSISWPAFSDRFDWSQTQDRKLGLLHFDAHTDLLSQRLGVRYCFATWAYHANELLERDGRLVQVGIRASGRTREHWERKLGVRQYWPQEYQSKDILSIADEISKRFHQRKVDALYVSNDIDATDSQWASATGTPESDGLHPDQVSELTLILARRFPLVGADIMEVAPPLGQTEGEPNTTLQTAKRYLADLLTASSCFQATTESIESV